jgi:hypothetical protein
VLDTKCYVLTLKRILREGEVHQSMAPRRELCCAVLRLLCCVVLCCVVLCCVVLCCAVLCCDVFVCDLCCVVLWCVVLCSNI